LEPTISDKTLFVTNDFGPRAGGIETFIIGLIERLPKSSIIVYTSAQENTDAYDADWLNNYGVEVIRDRAKILLPTPRVNRAVTRIVKEYEIKTIAFGAAAPLGWMSSALRKAGAQRIVALTHGHEVWWAKVFPFNLILRRIGSTTDSLTYLGEFTRTAIAKSLTPKSAAAMQKIAPGIDIEHFKALDATALRQSLGLAEKKVIVSVGRLVHRKGQDFLIESMPQILKQVPDAHLLLVGQGPYRERLEKLVTEHSLQKSVSFIGRIQYKDLPGYICVGDIFAMPSRSRFAGLEVEGLGIVYLEASACGLPVIAGTSGGAPDAVIEGVTGFVVDGTNTEEIAHRAIQLLLDEKLRNSMGSAGRAWIEKEWRWQIWAGKFSELLAR
jgi:phosphatidylinositol alpha-1,6-mannosyltransferase